MEHITFEADKGIDWLCVCGNTPGTRGFLPCDEKGQLMEPTIESNWNGLYICDTCRRIINQETLEVVGRDATPRFESN